MPVSEQNIFLQLQHSTKQISWFLLTKVPPIVVQPIVDMHGHLADAVLYERLFLYVDAGNVNSVGNSPKSVTDRAYTRYSILPALSLNGIIALDIVEGSFNKRLFAHFIDGLLDQMNPFPLPNSVVVMDNCRIHKDPVILEMITARGMRYQFLPPYSPDYNPIELAFSSIKARISREGGILRAAMTEEDDMDVYLLLNEAVYGVTERDAKGWFEHSGYSVED